VRIVIGPVPGFLEHLKFLGSQDVLEFILEGDLWLEVYPHHPRESDNPLCHHLLGLGIVSRKQGADLGKVTE
jgi:hypothetical protein